MTHSRSGFTLIELLASAVLLAAIAAACLPVFVNTCTEHQESLSVDELGRFADRLLSNPGASDEASTLFSPRMETAEWSAHHDEHRVLIRRVPSTLDNGIWLVFESGDVSVSRWVKAPAETAP